MKKTINLLYLLILINLLVLCNLVVIKFDKNLKLSHIANAEGSTVDKDNYNLIITILKDCSKENLIKYADYIELNFIETIPNDNSNKIAFTLSLPQDVSFIAIYENLQNGKYQFNSIIDGLSNIDSFYFYKNFLIVEQSDSSKDFTERKFFEVFLNKNNKYISVFNKNIYSSKIIENKKDTNSAVFKELEVSSIDYLEGDVPRILAVTTITKYKSKPHVVNTPYEFIELNKNTKKEVFEWNENKEIFSIIKSIDYK